MSDVKIPELDVNGLRRFAISTGLAILAIFGGLLPWLFDLTYPIWPWITLGILSSWALIAPKSLRPIYLGWMKFAIALGKITTPIILGILFFGVFFPVALAMKIIGRDPMTRKIDSQARTYKISSKKLSPDNLERPY